MSRIMLALTLAALGGVSAPATRHPVGVTAPPLRRGDRDLAPQLWYPAPDGMTTHAFSRGDDLCRDRGGLSRRRVHALVADEAVEFFARTPTSVAVAP